MAVRRKKRRRFKRRSIRTKSIGETFLRLVRNPNGSVSIHKGHKYDSTFRNSSDLNRRIKTLVRIGFKNVRGRPVKPK